MAITPNSTVHFLNVPLENNYKNQIYFENRDLQTSYMMSRKTGFSYENLTYQRKDNIIRVPTHLDNLLNSNINYVMYKNTNYSNRWFYAFVTKMEYINDGRTDVYIETDVWQTWFDKVNLKHSFVEREHVMDDEVGNHTYPEDLETGEYICNSHSTDDELTERFNNLCYILSSTLEITTSGTTFDPVGGGQYNSIYSGVAYYRFDKASEINEVLKAYAEAGQSDCVNGLFIAPTFLANATNNKVNQSTGVDQYEMSHSKNTTLKGYTPVNKKLLTYPYNYLLVSNNNGASVVYRYEDWDGIDNCLFLVKGALTPGCSIRMIPRQYKNCLENDEEGINLGKFPICNWSTDMYTNWMVQNSQSIAVSNQQNLFNGTVGAIGNLASLNVGGAVNSVGNAYFGIKSTMAEVHKQSLVPPQASGNLNCGDVITADNKNTFHFYDMSIKPEYAKIIDRYFDMYGYKINQVKVPNISGRPYWNYVKTIGCNLDGSINQTDLTKIREMFDNGVTFWKNGDYVEDYNFDNRP